MQHLICVQSGTEPINTRPYRLPKTQKVELEKQVEKLLKEGVIQESNLPWNSPILVVANKADATGQQKFGIVVDYRDYPLPDITEIPDQLRQVKYFSCLELAMGYHQIEMDPTDIEKAAFSMEQGHWAYRKMPLGLWTAPATFMRLMKTVLSGLTGTQ
jgi:hypothetical protein